MDSEGEFKHARDEECGGTPDGVVTESSVDDVAWVVAGLAVDVREAVSATDGSDATLL